MSVSKELMEAIREAVRYEISRATVPIYQGSDVQPEPTRRENTDWYWEVVQQSIANAIEEGDGK